MRARIGAPELRRPVQVVDRDGSIEAMTLSPDGHVALYCELVLGGQEGLIELVLGYRDPAGELRMRSRRERANYLPADACGALVRAAARARGRGEELFVTPLPRAVAEPGKGAARAGSVVWVDVDGSPGHLCNSCCDHACSMSLGFQDRSMYPSRGPYSRRIVNHPFPGSVRIQLLVAVAGGCGPKKSSTEASSPITRSGL